MANSIEYKAPAALEMVDDRIIHERMLSTLPPDIDKTQGGFAYDFTMPAAIEKSNMMFELNEAIQLFFPAWSYGVFLDQIAKEAGITRRPASKASGYITVTGAEGKRIPAGFKWSTPSVDGEENIEFETVESFTIDETRCMYAAPRQAHKATFRQPASPSWSPPQAESWKSPTNSRSPAAPRTRTTRACARG